MKPKIRFKGFEGEWKTSTIGEIAPLSGGYAFQSNHFSSVGIPIVRISNILETGIVGGVFAKYATFDGDADFRLYDGDAVIAMSGATTGKVAIVHTQGFLYQNQRVGKFTKTDRVIYDFLTTIVKSHKFRADLSCLLTSSAQPNASSKDIDSITQSIPLDKDEQQAIGKYFTSLDSQISASTSRLASLKQMKAASLQAMFPQEGETVPKIRFKGFEGEWKKVKLGDIAKFTKGQGYSKSDLKETGQPIILYGRMYTKYQFVIDEVDTFANLKDASILSEGDEIIMPASGETPEDIACASAVLAKDIILGGDLNIMHFDLTKISTPYIALVITYSKTHHDLSKCAQGKSVVHLHNGAISRATISLPSLAEQQAIASYFTSLDRQISLQSQRLEKLKQIKSACLDKMFV
mgnify:FL=1